MRGLDKFACMINIRRRNNQRVNIVDKQIIDNFILLVISGFVLGGYDN